ncbi:hypothetical protein [Ulvibacterium sp.]|uniref:hypothetical protein n=1 Tax=Ulvibacterium sp. TaxID=2665914 RepID=UPI002613AA1D|nr:hypothetical protein [Ulvibacterium sp.]
MRTIILETLYEWGKEPYRKYVSRKDSWDIPISDLLKYPKISLGFHLATFLLKYHFEVQPKLENRDVLHVLTNIGTSVHEEIYMQFYLFGNGKRNIGLLAILLFGILIFPDYLKHFMEAFKRGRKAFRFYYLDFSKMLNQPIRHIQHTFLIN